MFWAIRLRFLKGTNIVTCPPAPAGYNSCTDFTHTRQVRKAGSSLFTVLAFDPDYKGSFKLDTRYIFLLP